jgi:predicted nucleic acid-binding protein
LANHAYADSQWTSCTRASSHGRLSRGRLLAAARAEAFEVVACPLIFTEFRRGLAKPYFRDRVSATDAEELLDAFELLALVLPDPAEPPSVLRDPTDDFLVALASAAGAAAIVSSDRDARPPRPTTPGNQRTRRLRAARTASVTTSVTSFSRSFSKRTTGVEPATFGLGSRRSTN